MTEWEECWESSCSQEGTEEHHKVFWQSWLGWNWPCLICVFEPRFPFMVVWIRQRRGTTLSGRHSGRDPPSLTKLGPSMTSPESGAY